MTEEKQTGQELEALLRVKSHLLASALHDLHTPLVAIRGYSRMLLQETAGAVTPTQREYLNIILQNTNGLVKLLRSLTFASQCELQLESFDIRELWQVCAALIRQPANEKFIEILERIPHEPLLVAGDREKLRYALGTLAALALRRTNPGGQVSVELLRGRDDEVTVRINNTVSPAVLGDTPESSGRAAIPGHSRSEVDDEGLLEVGNIIRAHGATISTVGRPDSGFRYAFTLPPINKSRAEGCGPT